MLGYRTTNVEDGGGHWLVRFAAFENVVGHGASAGEARAKALSALIQWIDLLIEHRWAIPPPIDATDDEYVLVIDPIMASRIRMHNEMCRQPQSSHRTRSPLLE